MPTGIPTIYAGIRFRSRLEARWASLFDDLGWEWVYEPLDTDGWIPDFALTSCDPLVLVEVKPAGTIRALSAYIPKIEQALSSVKMDHTSYDGSKFHTYSHQGDSPYVETLLVGLSPFVGQNPPTWNSDTPGDRSMLGLLGGSWGRLNDGEIGWREYNPAMWMTCRECGQQSFFHPTHGFYSRICGHWDGDHHLDSPRWREIEVLWTIACNRSQWRDN